MDERMRFVIRFKDGETISSLCREFGISRVTGHKILDRHRQGTPFSYFSLNDFLNLADQLRTLPELIEYLNARQALPSADLLIIGDEKILYNLYLLNDGSFGTCASRADAQTIIAGQRYHLQQLLKAKSQSDTYSHLLEQVADELATRDPHIPTELTSLYEPLSERSGYLKMQGVLANMRLCDRVILGRGFHDMIADMESREQGFTFSAAYLDSIPDLVFVFGSCKRMDRAKLIQAMNGLTRAAMAHYGKPACLTVIDREGNGYELALGQTERPPNAEEIQLGQKIFGNLRMFTKPVSFALPL